MNKICSLLATGILLLTLGCAGLVKAQPLPLPLPENPKFLHYEKPSLGLNEEELLQVLGSPDRVEEFNCAVPLDFNSSQSRSATGDAWVYEHFSETPTALSLDLRVICVVNKHAVGEEHTVRILTDGVLYERIETLLNSDLAAKALRGQLDENSYEERTSPPLYSGPEYDI